MKVSASIQNAKMPQRYCIQKPIFNIIHNNKRIFPQLRNHPRFLNKKANIST